MIEGNVESFSTFNKVRCDPLESLQLSTISKNCPFIFLRDTILHSPYRGNMVLKNRVAFFWYFKHFHR